MLSGVLLHAARLTGQGFSRRVGMIKGLHHNAYRCRDSEETRSFYEDFLGLPLAASLEIEESKTGRSDQHAAHVLPARRRRRISPSSKRRTCRSSSSSSTTTICTSPSRWMRGAPAARCSRRARRRASRRGACPTIEFIHSIYFRDPNGYVIELTAKLPGHDEAMDPARMARAPSSTAGRRRNPQLRCAKKRSKPPPHGRKVDNSALVRWTRPICQNPRKPLPFPVAPI